MAHTKLKSTTEIKINFHPSELNFDSTLEESKRNTEKYLNSNELLEDDVMISKKNRNFIIV